MFEANAFLAMFTVQILAMSVLHPAWFVRHLRAKISPAERERDAQLYIERRLAQYRVLNTGVAVVGLLLLGWFFSYTRGADWDDGPIEALVGGYFFLQMLPLCLVSWIVGRINKELTLSLPKRKANLQRRGVFDFVSPATLIIAASIYLLFAALVIHIDQNPFPGFAGAITNIGIVTAGYALVALGVYIILYRTRSNPLESHAERMHTIGLQMNLAIYTCVAGVVFGALNMTLILLDLQRWEPFALSVFYVTLAFAYVHTTRPNATPRRPQADDLSSSQVA